MQHTTTAPAPQIVPLRAAGARRKLFVWPRMSRHPMLVETTFGFSDQPSGEGVPPRKR